MKKNDDDRDDSSPGPEADTATDAASESSSRNFAIGGQVMSVPKAAPGTALFALV